MVIENYLGDTIKRSQIRRLKGHDLGLRRRTYRGRPLLLRDLLFFFLLGTLSVIFPLAYGIYVFSQKYVQHGPIAAESWGRPWIVLALFSMLCLLLLALIRFYNAQIYVSTHKFGLDVKLSPTRRYILSWSDISGIATLSKRRTFFGTIVQNKFSIILFSTNGKSIHIDRKIQQITELAKVIKKNSYRRLLPSVQRKFKNGSWIDFGPLSINKEWLSVHNKRYSWRDVSKIYVKSGSMIIETKERKNLNIKTSQIQNIELFFLLIPRGSGV